MNPAGQTAKDGKRGRVLSKPIKYTGPELALWQNDAILSWHEGDSRGACRGTLEVFTGGGKTLLALAAATQVSSTVPGLRLAIVVPTQALQAQWVRELISQTDLTADDIGRVGGGRGDDWRGRRALVAVLNSAARKLPELCREIDPASLMLIVDECHRAGAPQFSHVLSTEARYRLGLSATPDRDELDEHGELISYDEQILGRRLGEVVFTFDLRKAREVGWLPEYAIHHHGIQLHDDERRDYDRLSRQVDDLADRLRSFGKEPGQARRLAARQDDLGKTASAYVSATAKRKDLLYRARERRRVVTSVLARTFADDPGRKALLFHERVDEAVALHESLTETLSVVSALEHSKLTPTARRRALNEFAGDRASVLVSVRSLVEGLNVPAADLGVSVASSSSVRQRVQSLGRVLRRRFDGEAKRADMHIVYVADTVDELIYAKEDWSDLTGDGANHYLTWALGAADPESVDEPPRTPRPTEEMEWQRLGEKPPAQPERWNGLLPNLDYSVDTRGTVLTPSGEVVRNPQGVAEMIRALRGSPGGRFRLTSRHRLVLVFHAADDEPPVPYVVGQVVTPFELLDTDGDRDIDVSVLKPGEPYAGSLDKNGGSYKLRQKYGGVIERRGGPSGSEFAVVDGRESPLALNAVLLLDAWRSIGRSGLTFHVNSAGHAWFLDAGLPLFLAAVPGGFTWPSDPTISDKARP
jgi:superfamily II DNA or RNA helicase